MESSVTTESLTVWGLLEDRCSSTPDDRFVWTGEWSTYAETLAATERLAAGLRDRGIERGDRVAVILPNVREAVLSVFACARLGAVQVPLNTFLRGEFLRYQLADSQAKLVITDALGLDQLSSMCGQLQCLETVVVVGDGEVDAARLAGYEMISFEDLSGGASSISFPDVRPEDVFSILYTSGTTGMPKGCLISHRYANHIGRALSATGRFLHGDTIFTASPLFHTSGQIYAMNTALTVHGAVAFEREFHASTFIAAAGELGADVIFGVGAVGLLLLAQPERTTDRQHRIRLGTFNGMPVEKQLALESRFGFHVIGEVFGHTEFIPMSASRVEGPRKRSSGGVVMSHVEVCIVDDRDLPVPVGEVGEIVARPLQPGVMFDGYWNNPEATLQLRRNLWHHTGDLGRLDEDGFLTFVDRKKDAIRRRGEFVVARELEAAIGQHPDVEAVAVHAVPSDLVEDEIRAWIVPVAGSELTADGLFEYFRVQLPYFAIPRFVDIVSDLPINQSARVMKHELKVRPVTEATWDFDRLGLNVPREHRRGVAALP